MADRAARAKKNKFSLDGLKEARAGGVSRLDQLEVLDLYASCFSHSIIFTYLHMQISWRMRVMCTKWLMKISMHLLLSVVVMRMILWWMIVRTLLLSFLAYKLLTYQAVSRRPRLP